MATLIDPTQQAVENPVQEPVLHFEILRRIAETASGMRYQDTYYEVVVDSATNDYRVNVYWPDPPPNPTGWVLKCTAWQRPPVPRVRSATIVSDQDKEVDLLNVPIPEARLQGWTGPKESRADAVFWSAAAVEKFLVPYYASTFGDLAPKVVEQLLNIFVPKGSQELEGNGMMEMADGRTPPRGAIGAPTLRTPEVTVGDSTDFDQPFAVVHLPNSEYTAQAGSTPLVTLHRSGAVKRFRLEVE